MLHGNKIQVNIWGSKYFFAHPLKTNRDCESRLLGVGISVAIGKEQGLE